MTSLMKKVKGCDSTASKLSTLCYIYLGFLFLMFIFALFSNYLKILKTKNNVQVTQAAILSVLIVFTPLVFIVYNMCRYKCSSFYFIFYLFLLSMFSLITQYIVNKNFPNYAKTQKLMDEHKHIVTIKFDDKHKKYVEVTTSNYNKGLILYSYDLEKIIDIVYNDYKVYKYGRNNFDSTNFVSDEDFIAVADTKNQLHVFSKKQNKKWDIVNGNNCKCCSNWIS